MRFIETPLAGAFIIEPDRKEDDRGYFARAYCIEEFKHAGIEVNFVQDNMSFNHKKNTIRGLHYQKAPYGEDKFARCVNGSVFDVIVDMREDSTTYLKWFGVELSAENGRALFVPGGFAHGYQTLTDHALFYYMVSCTYHPEAAVGIAYNDPKIGVKWKELECEMILSEQDKEWEKL